LIPPVRTGSREDRVHTATVCAFAMEVYARCIHSSTTKHQIARAVADVAQGCGSLRQPTKQIWQG
jgi:hypothetical protein